MAQKLDGGPAFPQLEKCGDMTIAMGGMTLRDYFAGQALVRVMMMGRPDHYGNSQYLAEQSYEIADAMIAARDA